MQGAIDKGGNLVLLGRAAARQMCMHANYETIANGLAWCGDWCPQFGDPTTGQAGTRLQICQGRELYFKEGDFTDERKKEHESK